MNHAKRVGLTIVLVGLFLGSLAVVVFIWPPLQVVRLITLASSRWILTDYDAGGGLHADGRKVIASWLSNAYAARLAEEIDATGARDDVQRIEQAVRKVQLHILTGDQVPHDPSSWPVLISGIGYCDQINSVVCRILVHWFPRAEIFALYDPAIKSFPHTVGRVWSPTRREWLYFDATYDRPLIYRRKSPGEIEILNPHAAVFDTTRLHPVSVSLYALDGSVMNAYQPSYFAWVFSRAVKPVVPPQETVVTPSSPSPPVPESRTPVPPTNDAVFSKIRSEYLEARIDDLCGDEREADRLYRLVANSSSAGADYRASELRLAAQHFVAVRGNEMLVTGN